MRSKKEYSDASSLRVICGAIAVGLFLLLALLWPRSYSWFDELLVPQIGSFRPFVTSYKGSLTISCFDKGNIANWRRRSIGREERDAFEKRLEASRKSLEALAKKSDADMLGFIAELEGTPGGEVVRGKLVEMQTQIKQRQANAPRKASATTTLVVMPFWVPLAITGCLAVALGWRKRWRFSLNTMLILSAIFAGFLALVLSLVRM